MTAPTAPTEPQILTPVTLNLLNSWEDEGVDFAPVYIQVQTVVTQVRVGEVTSVAAADVSPKGYATEPALTPVPGTTLTTVDLPPIQDGSSVPPLPSENPAPVNLEQSNLILVEGASLPDDLEPA